MLHGSPTSEGNVSRCPFKTKWGVPSPTVDTMFAIPGFVVIISDSMPCLARYVLMYVASLVVSPGGVIAGYLEKVLKELG